MIQEALEQIRKPGALMRVAGFGLAAFCFCSPSFDLRLNATEESKITATTTGKERSKAMEVPLIDGKKFSETLNRFKGKIVVVNLWATWCVPCRQEFPLLVKLYKQYKAQGMELVAISHDDIENLDDVKEFLEKRQVPFAVFVADPKDGENLREAIYPNWTGALPSTFFFDRSGALKARFVGTRSPEEFEATIKSLLSPGPAGTESPIIK